MTSASSLPFVVRLSMNTLFRLRCLLAALLALALLLPGLVNAADAESRPPGERPRIGLVLSGGGARGAAHIGVIKVLEEMRVPIDCIAGTSMGAIVGGLYAAGLSVEEMEKALTSIDWVDAFRDLPPREERSFRRKRDDDFGLINARIGVQNGRIALPRGAVQGQQLGLILRGLVFPVSKIENFDELRMPYRAVATDIGTGQAVVLSSGDLAEAMRASMSIPGLLAPVEINGRILVDGGVSNNLPVNVARETCADVVIAVSIGTPLGPAEDLRTVLNILGQLTTIMTQQNTQQQLATLRSGDILIEPDLGDITTANFSRAVEAIPIGARAARAKQAELQRLALPAPAYRSYTAKTLSPGRDAPVIDFIRIDNNSRLSDEVIRARLMIKPGDRLDLAVLNQDLKIIFGMDEFERVDYEIVAENGKRGLVIRTVTKEWGPNFLQLGLQLGASRQQGTFNFNLGYTMSQLNALGAEWRNELTLGSDVRLHTDFYQPLEYDYRYFVSPYAQYYDYSFGVYEGGNNRGTYRVRVGEAGLAGGRNLGSWGELRLGVRGLEGHTSFESGDPTLPPGDSFRYGGYFIRLWADRLDNIDFPRRGFKAQIRYDQSLAGLGADSPTKQIGLQGNWVGSWGRHTLIPRVELGARLDGELITPNRYYLGGFLNLSGFQPRELSGQYLGFGELIYYYQLNQLSSAASIPVYLGASLEAGNTWEERGDITLRSLMPAGSVFLGVDSPLGPFYLGGGFAEGGNRSFHMYLGRPF